MILKNNKFKAANPQTRENKVLKPRVLGNVRDLFNDLYYNYKDKYNEEKDGLNTKDKKLLYYKKLRLTEDYQYETEEEEKQNTSKKSDKKEPPKKPTKDNSSNFKKRVNEKETDINSEIFQEYFSHQRPSDMLKDLYTTNDKYKNNGLVNVIKNGSSDFKNETKNMSEKEK